MQEPETSIAPPLAHPEIVALYVRDVDRTLLRENLKLTPAQRVAKLESARDSLAMLRTARPVRRDPDRGRTTEKP